MNDLGTIEHNFSSHYYDNVLAYSKAHQETPQKKAERMRNYRGNSVLTINPLWKKAFSGREEYYEV